MNRWIDDAAQRQLLASKLHERYRNDEQKREDLEASAEQEKIDEIWRDACEKPQAKKDGRVEVCWRDLQHVSERVYNFQSSYGRSLNELVLDGIGLSSLEGLCTHCPDLTRLSVSSNNISDLTGIDGLHNLTRLNLLRNSLSHLPSSIGKLANLSRLDIANNKLVELPPEFNQLHLLKHINLECNELSELPVGFGRLKCCESLNLNSNSFRVFPGCVLDMPRLKHLSILSNQLTELYASLGKGSFPCLEVLHASRNRITVLPDSLVEISSLHCLWLDFNRLSSIPPNFHRLCRLRELKLEGNVDMIYPPIETIVLGTEEVLRWSRSRLEATKAARVRRIVQTLGEALSLVHRHRIGGDLHESLFRVNDDCFQFPPDALWNVFLPGLRKMWSSEDALNDGIKSFPFERHEVEQALFEFRDAAGPVVKRLPNARFRRCSCTTTGHRDAVCVPPRVGWMCSRPALLVRMKVAYEENMRERRRLLDEEQRIEEAAKTAEAIAKSFLESDDGMIMVRDEAEKRLSEGMGHRSPVGPATSSSIARVNKKVSSGIRNLISQFGRTSIRAELRKIEEKIRAQYIDGQISQRKQQVMEDSKKGRWIMQNWLGVTTDDVFRCWRDLVEETKRAQRKQQRRQLREERLQYEDTVATYELEKLELEKWEERYDDWNEMTVWVHTETGETLGERPSPPLSPLMPSSLTDSSGKPLSAEAIRLNEADSSSEGDDSTDDEGTASVEERGRPLGTSAEVELARKRVLERRMQLLM